MITAIPQSVLIELKRKQANSEKRRLDFVRRYGHARMPVCARMDDRWMVAIGGKIYRQVQENPYGFINVIHDHALMMFGEKFLESEEKNPIADRHPALQWMYTYIDHHEKARPNYPIGAGAAWIRFAYDLFTIGDNAILEKRMTQRLLDPRSFQSARHELRVAAMCVVAGFEVRFEDERSNSKKHPEFIGVDKSSSLKIAVEAKSRHRRDVQGFQGGLSKASEEVVDVRRQVLDAYKKQPDLPFYVFIETNLPPANKVSRQTWADEIVQTMSDLDDEGYHSPSPANMVFFVNDPSHYMLNDRIGNPADNLWIFQNTAAEPRIPHPAEDMASRFMRAHAQRSVPPTDLSEFEDF